MAFLIAVVTTPARSLTAFAAWAGMVAWASELAGMPVRRTLARATAVLPFSLAAVIGIPFAGGGETLELAGVRMSVEGIWTLAGVSMKAFLSAAMLSVVTSSTGFEGMVKAMRSLGMPALVADILSLSWRYLFLLADEAVRLKRAASARGFMPRWLPQAVIVGRLAGNLFVRSYERAERVHGAMMLRGFAGAMPVPRAPAIRPSDLAQAALALTAIAAARFLLA